MEERQKNDQMCVYVCVCMVFVCDYVYVCMSAFKMSFLNLFEASLFKGLYHLHTMRFKVIVLLSRYVRISRALCGRRADVVLMVPYYLGFC